MVKVVNWTTISSASAKHLNDWRAAEINPMSTPDCEDATKSPGRLSHGVNG
jgi:hypothetical protein